MDKRIPGSMRTRQSLSELIGDALGRDYDEHGAEPGRGHCNGVRRGRLWTAEGLVEFAAPQIAGRDAPLRSETARQSGKVTPTRVDLAGPIAFPGR